MEDFTQMLKRAHIQQLRSFLMDGTGLDNWYEDEDSRPYGQRLEEEERPIWKLLERLSLIGKALDEAVDKLTGALAANQSVFLETASGRGRSSCLICSGRIRRETDI